MKVKGDFRCEICDESFETNVEIAGHMRGHQVSVADERILSELKRLAAEKERPPTQPEVDEETEFTAGAVVSTFGNWKDGLDAAGLKPLSRGLSDEEIIDELLRVADHLGHSPSKNEMREYGRVSHKAVRSHFGSWNEGLRVAGLATTDPVTATKQDVIHAIQKLADQLGHPPTASDMERKGDWSVKVAQRCFGSWNNALRQSGFDPVIRRNIADEQLLEEIDRLTDELGRVPSSVDMVKRGKFTLYPYLRHYGSWKKVVESAGYEYRGRPNGQAHPLWKGGIGDISYGPNWYEQRKRAIERDNYQCQMPGCSIDRDRHLDLFDRDLNVHHIIPLETFIDMDGVLDYERANRLENLVTVCHRHHSYWEQLAPLRPDPR